MINLYDILEAADGQLLGEPAAILFTDFCFDSRRVREGELFVAVKTERGDGHNYMWEAIEGGALGVMCNRPPDFETPNITVIVMRNVEAALLNWAQIVLRKFGTTVIGVTGSSGKSTAKEAIAAVLSTRYRVFKSPGSFNGRFGLPLALGKLSKDDKLAVLEFGTDQFGEMADLVNATKPLLGAHQLYGILASLAVGVSYHIPIDEALRALQALEPLPGRLNPLEGKGHSLLIDDSFNANPESTLAALEWLKSIRLDNGKGRIIFVMGDMDELGGHATAGHREVGKRAAEIVDVFVTEGEMASVAGRAALDQGMERNQVRITFSPQDAANVIADSLTPDDVILVKGSPAARMEHVTRLLLENEEDAVRLPRTESAYDSVWSNRPSRPTWIEVDKSAIAHNVREFKEMIGPEVELMAGGKGKH